MVSGTDARVEALTNEVHSLRTANEAAIMASDIAISTGDEHRIKTDPAIADLIEEVRKLWEESNAGKCQCQVRE